MARAPHMLSYQTWGSTTLSILSWVAGKVSLWLPLHCMLTHSVLPLSLS